ncbi:P22 phage major capsid protein family protein [Bordetella hinzii]|uniref:Coat protein, P22 family n=1 Tax=Bordetella hinzii OH87 BAL007II TaxID=1331262 RepID=A0ABR4R647_9BORD|nr:P22 phage major capsid protein family protein [Bordetella hinzii]KCB26157.1 coat protein, P22 family [Bordetella hinzii OH87 BAL007II]
MANSLLTIDMITNEAVRLFTQTNAFMRTVNRQYDDQFARDGAKIGNTLRIRLPNDYMVSTGPAITPQGTNEQNTALTVATQKNVPVSFGTAEKTMSLDDFSERILAPAVNRLAASVAADLMNVANESANLVYRTSSGNMVSPDPTTWLDAGAKLDFNLSPRMDRAIILDPRTQARTIGSMAGLFNPQQKISGQYETGLITKDTLGFDWMYDQTTKVHTVGSFTSGTVNGAGQTGNTLVVNAITGTLNKGDIITIAGVNAINRLTGEDQGELRQFVVTANVASGATSIPIYPSIVAAPAAFNTVTAAPANNAAISLVATAGSRYRQNLAFYPEAFTLATADLQMPTAGVVQAARAQFDGISLRMIESYDIMSDQLITRLDILYGFKAIRPEWACVVADVL